MDSKPQILIVGGGVIGTACAYQLSERGARVTLIDRGEVGRGCSYGNAGLIVPSHSFPLPVPGMVLQASKWLLKSDSPFYVKPRLSWDLLTWLLRFAGASTHRHLLYASAALAALSKRSAELYEQLGAVSGEQMGYKKSGGVYVFGTAAGLRHGVEEMEILRPQGILGRQLSEEELRELEPAVTGRVSGATYFEGDAHAEPLAVVQTLASLSRERGVEILPKTELIDWHCRGGLIESVRTTRGTLKADQVVLAGGSWSPPLARKLGLKVPIQAGKGYAVTIKPFSPTPRIPALLGEPRVGVTPRADSVRIAGTLELAGLDESISTRRVDAAIRGARRFFNVPAAPEIIEVWRGLRPCTPDGLPIIGRHDRWQNLTIAAGHAMLGLTLGAATGELVADIILGNAPSVDPAPFQPSRFD